MKLIAQCFALPSWYEIIHLGSVGNVQLGYQSSDDVSDCFQQNAHGTVFLIGGAQVLA